MDFSDGQRWRALLSSGRLRWLGCAGFDWKAQGAIPVPRPSYTLHFGMEVWSEHATRNTNSQTAALLVAYADERLRRMGAATEPQEPDMLERTVTWEGIERAFLAYKRYITKNGRGHELYELFSEFGIYNLRELPMVRWLEFYKRLQQVLMEDPR